MTEIDIQTYHQQVELPVGQATALVIVADCEALGGGFRRAVQLLFEGIFVGPAVDEVPVNLNIKDHQIETLQKKAET